MNTKGLFKPLIFMSILSLSTSAFAEKIMVDKEEWERMKAAVEALTRQQTQTQETAAQAAQDAEEAQETAEAAVEAVENNPLAEAVNNVSIGGYGELHYNNTETDDGMNNDEIDFHRFVLFFGYQFTDNLRFFSEFELEHALAGDDKPGEVELEQAFIEYDINQNASVLGGVFLLPVGILNETHEPNTFYGVERNAIENVIIPATWWEAGAMYTQRIGNGLQVQAAFHSGLAVPTSGSSTARIRSGRQKVAEADASDFAYTAAISYTGMPGLEIGGAVQFQEDISQDQGDGFEEALFWQVHLAFEKNGFGLRALYAEWDIDGDVIEALGDDEQNGWYIEPSYKITEQFGIFARHEYVRGAREQDHFNEWRVGANYWPHPQVVLKFDWQDRELEDDDRDGEDFDGYNLGIGYQF